MFPIPGRVYYLCPDSPISFCTSRVSSYKRSVPMLCPSNGDVLATPLLLQSQFEKEVSIYKPHTGCSSIVACSIANTMVSWLSGCHVGYTATTTTVSVRLCKWILPFQIVLVWWNGTKLLVWLNKKYNPLPMQATSKNVVHISLVQWCCLGNRLYVIDKPQKTGIYGP